MAPDIWIAIGLGLVGSGGIVAWVRARAEAPKLAAEAHTIIISDLSAENTRLKAELVEIHKQLAKALGELESLRGRVRLLESGD